MGPWFRLQEIEQTLVGNAPTKLMRTSGGDDGAEDLPAPLVSRGCATRRSSAVKFRLFNLMGRAVRGPHNRPAQLKVLTAKGKRGFDAAMRLLAT
jgi:hypothetical protein